MKKMKNDLRILLILDECPHDLCVYAAGSLCDKLNLNRSIGITQWDRKEGTSMMLSPFKEGLTGLEMTELFNGLKGKRTEAATTLKQCDFSPLFSYLVDVSHHGSFDAVLLTSFNKDVTESIYLSSTTTCTTDVRLHIISLFSQPSYKLELDLTKVSDSFSNQTKTKKRAFANEYSLPYFSFFINLSSNQADHLIDKSIDSLMTKVFAPYKGELTCGNLRTWIRLHPEYTLNSIAVKGIGGEGLRILSKQLLILGFIKIDSIVNVPYISRHFIASAASGDNGDSNSLYFLSIICIISHVVWCTILTSYDLSFSLLKPLI
jgi:hypothetical protein